MARLLPACLLALLFASATTAEAQDVNQDPYDTARFHLGAIRFTPYVVISDIGVDTNVYNESDAQTPKQDFTATFGPGVNYWFNLGRARVSAKSELTYTWFQQYADQRSFNTGNEARLALPLNRLTPFVDGHYDSGRRRVSFEIDSRSYSTDALYGGGLDLRVTGKSTFRVEAHHGSVDFRQDEYFAGENLRDSLNRDINTSGVSWRESLTPLTTFAVKTEYEQDRFTYSPVKDANGFRVMPGFEFDPNALIGGSVYVGYRRFNALSPEVPDFSGLVADIRADYRMRATRFDVLFNRDITYSYQETEPYYVLSNVGLQVKQKITHQWDVVGLLGRQWLSYSQIMTPGEAGVDRLDRSYGVGGGVGYELAEDVRVGMNLTYYGRTSNTVTNNQFNGLRFGAAISYGLSTK